jgi:hypothetical protein
MDLSDDDVKQRPEADRREVDPQIEVEAATWSPGGQLDWWVKNGESGAAGCAVLTAVNGGSGLLIFVPRAAHSHDLSLSLEMLSCTTRFLQQSCCVRRTCREGEAMTELSSVRGMREFPILGDYDPGQFVFDYFNEMQIKDLAQSLGLDLVQSREVKRERASSGNWKFSVKVVETGVSAQRLTGESAAHLGALPTATLIEVLVRLREERRLDVLSQPTVDRTLDACRAAMGRLSWVIVEGLWRVHAEPISLVLLCTADGADLSEESLIVRVEVPGGLDDFTPSGRLRLTPGRQIRAHIFAQPEHWNEERREFTVIGHAVFARMGDSRFRWHRARFGDSSDGDF